MPNIKFCRAIRKIRTTSHAGLIVFKRLTDQLELLTPLESQEFIKLHGHAMKSLFFALLIKSLMGTPSMDEFEDEVNNDRFIRKIANFTRKLGKTVLGRNMKRLKRAFLHQDYFTLIRRLIDRGLVTLSKIAIDATFIEVFGKGYQKAAYGWGKTKIALGYRLSVAFDVESKLPIAYILTFGSVHDSQHLIPLVEIIKSKYGTIPEQVVLDRAYYGQDFFKYLSNNGVEFAIPIKKYVSIIKSFQRLDPLIFRTNKHLNLKYTDDYVFIEGYGWLRVIWLVCVDVEDWMPKDLKPGDWWGLLTNRVDLPPVEVIQAYKDRWEIEVFFRGVRQRMALGKLPGRDFRQIQAHVFFVFIGYLLLLLIRHIVPFDDEPLRINLTIIQKQVLFVKAVFQEKGRQLNVHFTSKSWLFYSEEEITLS
jgi:transposase